VDCGFNKSRQAADGSRQQAEGKHYDLELKSLEVGGQENRFNILSPGF
jgi:hypothetical protein